jgi:prepilin-type processing-associated H-X9-DG protein
VVELVTCDYLKNGRGKMNETETNAGGRKPKISRLAIGEIVAAVIIFVLIIAILWPVFIRLREYRRRIRCGENLAVLGKTMLIYACDYDDKYPTADKWCDLLVKYTEVTEVWFVCPSAGKGRCHYAINPNASAVTNPDMVVLFETKGCWNQFGGAGLVSFENHEGKGCNMLFNDLHVKFVKPNQLVELKWKDEQKQ